MLQSMKRRLVALGPEHWALRASLHLAAFRAGWRLSFTREEIRMRRGNRVLALPSREYVSVPMMFSYSQLYFDTMVPRLENGLEVWDYSRPDWHAYRRSGLEFYSPALPEDDIFNSYTHWYTPAAGDVVWDAGAHAGVTSYYLAQLVGAAGKVYAFEPDSFNYSCLLRNVERHKLTNVVPVQKALAGSTGTAEFQMIGTMAAGLRDYLGYPDSQEKYMEVATLSLEDACSAYGVPNYIKMDIEGAEVSVLAASLDFLRKHAIEFAIESHHLVDNRLTYLDLDQLFPQAGYESESSLEYQLWYTWARPRKNPK
jgi:FkbM family methyltransferase